MSTVMERRPYRELQPGPEPTRARYPDEEGFIERDGVKVFWERYGDGSPTLLLLPSIFPIGHSRSWRAWIPYFARHHRVVAFDPRGNGRSDRVLDSEAYALDEHVADMADVLDASATCEAVVAAGARGAMAALKLAGDRPERVAGLVLLGPQPRNQRQMVEAMFKGQLDAYEGWDKFNPEYWRQDFHGFLEWFAGMCFPEPHYTRAIESMIEYALGTDPETLIAASFGKGIKRGELPAMAERIECPALVLCGELDFVNPPELAREVAELLDAPLEILPKSGHGLGKGIVRCLIETRAFVESLDG